MFKFINAQKLIFSIYIWISNDNNPWKSIFKGYYVSILV